MVPFLGDRRAAGELAAQLERLDLRDDDELVVADNTGAEIAALALDGRARVLAAGAERSSYHARNAGARAASREWLLFLDADCTPAPGLLTAHFRPPPPDSVGAIGGAIVAPTDGRGLLVRYAVSRHFYCAEHGLQRLNGYAPSANLLVRRAAFEALGGFSEGIRSAGDVELCWRLQAAGWTLGQRPRAIVAHRHRAGLGSFVSMLIRYGAGASWLDRRYPGSSPRWPLALSELSRCGRDAARHTLAGDRDEAAFRLIDILGLLAHNVGYRRSNEVGR